jgi:predicted nucleic acid-binding Zn finger protein
MIHNYYRIEFHRVYSKRKRQVKEGSAKSGGYIVAGGKENYVVSEGYINLSKYFQIFSAQLLASLKIS